jgi:hypothetical protein
MQIFSPGGRLSSLSFDNNLSTHIGVDYPHARFFTSANGDMNRTIPLLVQRLRDCYSACFSKRQRVQNRTRVF